MLETPYSDSIDFSSLAVTPVAEQDATVDEDLGK